MIGEVLDNRYRVLKSIGGGGMGEVYLVENLGSSRREALKILRARLYEAERAKAVQRAVEAAQAQPPYGRR